MVYRYLIEYGLRVANHRDRSNATRGACTSHFIRAGCRLNRRAGSSSGRHTFCTVTSQYALSLGEPRGVVAAKQSCQCSTTRLQTNMHGVLASLEACPALGLDLTRIAQRCGTANIEPSQSTLYQALMNAQGGTTYYGVVRYSLGSSSNASRGGHIAIRKPDCHQFVWEFSTRVCCRTADVMVKTKLSVPLPESASRLRPPTL